MNNIEIERKTFIDSKGNKTYGYTITNDGLIAYDNSFDSFPYRESTNDDIDLIESAMNTYPEFFDTEDEKFTVIIDDESDYNQYQIKEYIKKLIDEDLNILT